MAVGLEQFVKSLEDSGIITPSKLQAVREKLPSEKQQDAQELARELVRLQKLTKFQAQEAYQGKARNLVLGNYVILDKIGAGGMGQVYKAQHRRMDRIVAIKMLPSSMTKDAAAIARFEREVKAAAKLRHPNIIAADDADAARGIHFLVMEYVEGSDLSALVKKNGPFSVEKSVNYVLQAARGLEYAHSEGVVHRDIKPANLLLDKKGTVKILDMGLARLESGIGGEAATAAELTTSGQIMGTVDYMSPEQAFNTKQADSRADIYSLGCTFFYLLTGKPLFGGETIMEKLLAHRERPIPSLTDLRDDVSAEIEAVYQNMVAKKVEDRYQSMSEVITDLQPLVGGGSTMMSSLTGSTNAASSNSNLTFLKEAAAGQTIQRKTTKQIKQPLVVGGNSKNRRLALIRVSFLGVLILAGIIVSLQTQDGTLVVEVDQPNAVVQLLDAEGKVEVSQKGGVGKVTISVDPGKHRLRVEKDGFTVFGQEFEMEAGGNKAITAKLVPVKFVVAVDQPNKPWTTPAFQAWVNDVQILPADKQVDAVFQKLLELNPGEDPKRRPGQEIKDGTVVELRFSSANKLVNLSPVRALSQLKSLVLSSCPELEDLSPLEGMSLTSLHLHANKVKSFSPLQGMPLTKLTVSFTPVKDLSPLAGMRLEEVHLHACPARDRDLAVFRGMPITQLQIGAVGLRDLEFMRGLPLQKLALPQGSFSDLTPLQGMSLVEFDCDNNINVSDVTPLCSCKSLLFVSLKQTKVTPSDVAALQRALPNCTITWDDPAKTTTPAAATGPAPPLAKAPFDAAQAKAHQQEWATHLGIEVETPNSVGMKLVLIPPGEFLMGSTDEQAGVALKVAEEIKADQVAKDRIQKNERPQHRVIITKPMLMGVTEVTVGQFRKFVEVFKYITEAEQYGFGDSMAKVVDDKVTETQKQKNWRMPGYVVTDDSPVAQLTWNDAVAYCHWLSTQEKATYRLPTEAEWEYACRAGTTTQYSFSDDYNELPQYGWHNKNAGNAGGKSYPVGTLMPNNFGLFDMHGNLYEWCGDYYDEKWYSTSPLNDPIGPRVGSYRVIRGGVWSAGASYCRSASRSHLTPSYRSGFYGFRIVRELPAPSTTASVTPQPAAPAKPITDFNSPEFLAWMREVQAMPAEEQVKAVCKKLVELNSGFDGKVTGSDGKGTPKVENNVVTQIGLNTTNTTDISPLRALSGLQVLICSRTAGSSGPRLADLAPLAGLPLTTIDCTYTSVSDLTPLRGMPLTKLICLSTPVSDLSPLSGMKLKYLICGSAKLSDLSPLKGMPLEYLSCRGGGVSDLSPLRRLPLRNLYVSSSQIIDLSPLLDCPDLVHLDVTKNPVDPSGVDALIKALPKCKIEWDDPAKQPPATTTPPAQSSQLFMHDPAFPQWMAQVQAMPAEEQIQAVSKKLVELNQGFDGKVTDFAGKGTPTIEGGVVTEVGLSTDAVADISALRAFQALESLNCNNGTSGFQTRFNDLRPLAGLNLSNLRINNTQVSDLTPLRSMPLSTLICYFSSVGDLTPLTGMPLTRIVCRSTAIVDLSPLETCKHLELVDARNTKVTTDSIAALQNALPNCNITWDDSVKATTPQLAASSTKLFMHDPAFPQWMKDVQAMPAQQQINAVSKKLMELNPEFDGDVSGRDDSNSPPSIKGNMVEYLGFVVDNVADISPVRALAGLRSLTCRGSTGRNGRLADVSPLQGMKLVRFDCTYTNVSDLSPLRGMQLLYLYCGNTSVADLSPLSGMPLKHLSCYNSNVSDLSPLEGCSDLGHVIINRTNVTPAAVVALQKALPNCKIEWDDPSKPQSPQPAASGSR